MEETEGRKTRSTRAKKTPVKKPPTPRATRGRKAKAAVDDEVENDQIEGQEEVIEAEVSEHENASEENHEEQALEDSDQPNPQEVMAQLQEIVVPVEESDMGHGHESKDESSSNFAFEEFPTDTLTYEQSSNEKEENPKEEVFIADLAEENANSLPSGCDENSRNDSGEKHSENREFNIQEKQAESGAMEVDGEDKPQTESGSPADKDRLAEEKEAKSEHNETGESDFAIAETIENGTNEATDLDAEMVSEDELPAPHKPKVQDAEEVSDDELPGPKMAELPADTEVVSEEEMPNKDDETASKKDAIKRKIDDYDPSSPTEDSEAPEKKAKTDSDTEKADKPKPKLPDLDKYWKAVNEDTTDFTAWTYLLQYVDQENDVDAAREAYDAFLAHYPYCYGYWRKYADYEKRKGNKDKCEEVFERGLKAIPLSVDLWIHYLTHVKQTAVENLEFVRNEFERALTACGLEFRSDKLWEAYIKWENEGKNIRNVVNIYDRLLATPTQGYNNHFDNFKDVINNHPPHLLVTTKEFLKLREEIRRDFSDGKEVETDDQVPPGEDEPDDHVRNEEEAQAIKDRICSKRKKIHKATVAEVTNRWTYEEGIKRPYFHVKPLERCQLKNWKEYLDFEIEQGDQKRIIVLFERCLIACALYDEFWLKLLRYLESRKEDPDFEAKARDAYERACNIHHKDKPSLHLMWSAFEETHNNADKAAEILQNLEKTCPNLLQVAYRRINLERRRGDFEKCVELYEHYISTAKNKSIAGSLAIKYARFLHKIKQDLEGALKLLKQSLEKDSSNTRIALQYIDLALQREHVDETEIVEIMDNFMAREGIDPDQKVLFAQRKVEFLEDFGTNVKGLQEAQRALQQTLNKANEHKKKSSSGRESPSKKSKETSSASGNGVPSSYNYSGYGQSGQGQYYGTGSSQYSYGNTGYDYNQWSGYQQSAGYTNYGQYGYGSYY